MSSQERWEQISGEYGSVYAFLVWCYEQGLGIAKGGMSEADTVYLLYRYFDIEPEELSHRTRAILHGNEEITDAN